MPRLMGTLYLVGTPIGNLEDISLRALRILREIPLIAAEDTRVTSRILKRYKIETPLTSYHEHNKLDKLSELLTHLENKDLALVSDAGMPGLSDPGFELVQAAAELGIQVVPIPGPSAVISALVVSGLPTDRFIYLGFLPRRPTARRQILQEVAQQRETLVAYESPHRLLDALKDIERTMGERPLAVARELTKLHEEIVRGKPAELLQHFSERRPRGEITLVIGGSVPPEWDDERVATALAHELASGASPSAAARVVAKRSGRPRRELYQQAIKDLAQS
jgi:16S rRNA (cytidine1402-2'-O)-methyltransferase